MRKISFDMFVALFTNNDGNAEYFLDGKHVLEWNGGKDFIRLTLLRGRAAEKYRFDRMDNEDISIDENGDLELIFHGSETKTLSVYVHHKFSR